MALDPNKSADLAVFTVSRVAGDRFHFHYQNNNKFESFGRSTNSSSCTVMTREQIKEEFARMLDSCMPEFPDDE